MERRISLALVVLLALAPEAGAWAQQYGSAARAGSTTAAPETLDVLGSWDLGDDVMLGNLWSVRALETRAGVLVLHDPPGEGCDALRFTDLATGAHERVPLACDGETLQGYDEATDVVLTCRASAIEAPILRARNGTTLEVRWEVTPAQLGIEPQPGFLTWSYCSGPALDPEAREVVGLAPLYQTTIAGTPVGTVNAANVPVATGGRVFAVSLDDGAVLWSRPLTLRTQAGVDGEDRLTSFRIHGLTLTDTGIVATGRTACAACRLDNSNTDQSVVAWFDRTGTPIGYLEAKTGRATDPENDIASRRGAASYFAVGQGPFAGILLGGRVTLINPETSTPIAQTPVETVEPPTAWVAWPPTHWVDTHLVVGLPHSLTSYDSNTLEREWSWSEGQDWFYRDGMALPTGEILALVGRFEPPAALLVRLDAATGAAVQRLPLPISPTGTLDGSWYVEMSMTRDGVLLVDNVGRAVLLGRADSARAPQLPADLYPPVAAPFQVTLATPGAASFLVDWGDGTEATSAAAGQVEHTYLSPGDRTLRATAIYPDGTTATARVLARVGADPPPELTPLQKAFAPENQNLTFGVLGILVTVVGAFVTIGRHRHRFARLERELDAVEEIRMLSVDDPRGAVLSLKAYRARLPDDLARRRIDDSQYQVLDVRTARLLRVLRARLLAPYDQRLSASYHRLLDAAFDDAIITRAEEATLREALANEALDQADREALHAILADFTSNDAPGRARRPVGTS